MMYDQNPCISYRPIQKERVGISDSYLSLNYLLMSFLLVVGQPLEGKSFEIANGVKWNLNQFHYEVDVDEKVSSDDYSFMR